MPRHPGFSAGKPPGRPYPVLTSREDGDRAGALRFPSQLPQHQRSFSGLDLECRVAVGPASSGIRCHVTHLCSGIVPRTLVYPLPRTLVYPLEFALIYLCHSPQASGGTGTWRRLLCYLQTKPVQTPPRAWMPRVSCWPEPRHLRRIPRHCLGLFSLQCWAENKEARRVF